MRKFAFVAVGIVIGWIVLGSLAALIVTRLADSLGVDISADATVLLYGALALGGMAVGALVGLRLFAAHPGPMRNQGHATAGVSLSRAVPPQSAGPTPQATTKHPISAIAKVDEVRATSPVPNAALAEVQKIQQLAALYREGVLSRQEFDAARARVFDGS